MGSSIFDRTGSPTRSRRRFLEGRAGARNGSFGLAFAVPGARRQLLPRAAVAASNRLQRRRLRADKMGGRAPLARSLLTQQFGVTPRPVARRRRRRGRHGPVRAGQCRDRSGVGDDPDAASRRGGGRQRPGVDARRRGPGRAGARWRGCGSAWRRAIWRRRVYRADDGAVWRVDRQVRVGVAVVGDADRAGRQVWIVACDADLTRERTPIGDRRERRRRRRAMDSRPARGMRGGVDASTVGRRAAGGDRRRQRGGAVAASLSKAGSRRRRSRAAAGASSAHVMF